ncbi:MAG: hypothetical protein WBP45_13660 [Daejeonella sp.]
MKKAINYTATFAAIIVLILSASSCKKEVTNPLEKTPAEKIIGKWVLKSLKVEYFDGANVKVHEESSLPFEIIYEFSPKQITVTAFDLTGSVPYFFITENGKNYITYEDEEDKKTVKSLIEFQSDNHLRISVEKRNDSYLDETSGELIPARSVTIQKMERM